MIDKYGRKINYLRLSITDRCNHRCFYCMDENVAFLPKENLLKLDELASLVQIFRNLGITKVRITGGEPLLREDIIDIVKIFSKEFTVTMTTNGSLLSELAQNLKESGLSSINVSLNSLRQDTFFKISQGNLKKVIAGIDEALKICMNVKINTVVSEYNFNELPALVTFATEKNIPIRFIELMPIGKRTMAKYFEQQIMEKLAEFRLTAVDIKLGEGPARYFVTKDGNYVGLISAMSKSFCTECNKIRVSCDGKLYPCLGSSQFFDLITHLRKGAPIDQLQNMIMKTLETKPYTHSLKNQPVNNVMNRLGG